eukprot:Em0665g3a
MKNNSDWPTVVASLNQCLARRNGDLLDPTRLIECIYYLSTYGTAQQVVAFYSRCSLWSDACKYILDHSCPVEVFVENLWVPALKAGEIDQVQNLLLELDETLARWDDYLMAVCRCFTQKGLLHILYSTQLFMKDYIRAGLTCIRFFMGSSGKATFGDLFARRKHLTNANQHFQLALNMRQHSIGPASGKGARRGVAEDTPRGGASGTFSTKSMDIRELQLHLTTIELQSKQLPPATLFGRTNAKIEVAASVMIYSSDTAEALKLVNEIIHAFKLSSSNVFCCVSQMMAEKEQYANIRSLIQELETTSYMSEALNDDIAMAAIKVATSKQSKEMKHVEKLISLLKMDRNQIKAQVLCGKLKNAYLLAIKSKMSDEVRNISEIAEKAGQLNVRDICEKWLQANSPR